MTNDARLSALLAAIGAPDLRGARCAGSSDLWQLRRPNDPNYDYTTTAAIRGCLHECPALAQCRQLLAGMPVAHRPRGTVMAGQIITTPPRKTAVKAPSAMYKAAMQAIAAHESRTAAKKQLDRR